MTPTKLKRIVFEDYDVVHAALILKLRHLKVSQRDFFQYFIEMFLSESDCLTSFTERLLAEKSSLGLRSKSKRANSVQAGNALMNSLNLSKQERDDIFDILETENFQE